MRDLKGIRVATLTLGCKVNQYETSGMRELMEHAGAELVEWEQQADIYLVNTCSVTNMAERKSRQMLHKARKQNANAVVVAVGCYVQTMPQEVLEDFAVDLVVGNNQKKDIVQILLTYMEKQNADKERKELAEQQIYWQDINQQQAYEELKVSEQAEHTRAYIKIQDGCNQFCSYCIIPYVRGRIRSRQMTDILEELETLAGAGYKEVVLTGIHLSSYGNDWREDASDIQRLDGTELLTLIQKASEIEGIRRIRLGSLEPRIITEDFAHELAKLPKVCPHFHLSLQSACNETLKRMNRKYTIEAYMKSCEILRTAYDRPALTTDVIVGFPGETEEEFQVTCENLEELKLYEMHVFKYSPRRGTVAEKMQNQVPETVKSRRSDRLLQMAAAHKQEYEEGFRGERVRVLIEEALSEKGNGWYVGHTERYMKVEVYSEKDIINQIIEVTYA